MKILFTITFLLLFSFTASAQCIGCDAWPGPDSQDCLDCHYATSVGDHVDRRTGICSCESDGGGLLSHTQILHLGITVPASERFHAPGLTEFGQIFNSVVKGGSLLDLLFGRPAVVRQSEFLAAHRVTEKAEASPCGRRTLNRIIASNFLDRIK